jgi:hypothetical protein
MFRCATVCLLVCLPAFAARGSHTHAYSGSHSSYHSHSYSSHRAHSHSSTYHAPRTYHAHAGTTHYPGERDKHGHLERSEEAKGSFKRQHPCPSTGRSSGACPGYVVDHVRPLECGGADAPSNMQWQTVSAGKAKDKTEHSCR